MAEQGALLAFSSASFVKPTDASRLCRVISRVPRKKLLVAGKRRVIASLEGPSLRNDRAKGQTKLQAVLSHIAESGDVSRDVDGCNYPYLGKVFSYIQMMIDDGILSANYDISNGGVVVSGLELASNWRSAGTVDNSTRDTHLSLLFVAELGLLLQIDQCKQEAVIAELLEAGVQCHVVACVTSNEHVSLAANEEEFVSNSAAASRSLSLCNQWRFGFVLGSWRWLKPFVQAKQGLKYRETPAWKLSFTPLKTSDDLLNAPTKPKVAIITEEGSNGDREQMSATALAAGFEPWDVSMSDLLDGRACLKDFKGVVFVGGLSSADVLGSARGWQSSTIWSGNNSLHSLQFQDFYNRPDTFSLGVCHGCQWVPGAEVGGTLGAGGDAAKPRFVPNGSGRFECGFSSVRIVDSPAIMLKGMTGTIAGLWTPIGKRRALFPNTMFPEKVLKKNPDFPLTHYNNAGEPKFACRFNPNESVADGIAALCSPDGRHLTMMPQKEWSHIDAAGPSLWLRFFQNAREWCESV